MKVFEVIKNIKEKEIINFLRDQLCVQLEEAQFADAGDVQQRVFKQYFSISNKAVWVFSSDDEEHFITARLDAYDYELEYSELSYDNDYRRTVVKEPLEDEQEHLEGRKKYINFIAGLIQKEYGDEASEKYVDRARQKFIVEDKIM